MADFLQSIEKTLVLEGFGKLTDLKNDPGGLTKWGISRAAHPHVDIANLSREGAIAIYRRDYWNPLFDRIDNQEVADEIFDFGVNVGVRQAAKTVQESLRYLTVGPLVVDSNFGEKTLTTLNCILPSLFLREFRARESVYYATLCINRADSREFLLGWMRRVMA